MKNAIFITFDENFYRYARICLKSIELNYPNHPEILAYYDGNKSEILDFLSTINNLKVMPFKFDFINLQGINLGKVNSKKVYFRYILWTSQFDSYDTIVHLDIDTIILQPFDSLFSKDTFFAINDFTPFRNTLFDRSHYETEELKQLLAGDDLGNFPEVINMMNAGVFVIPKKFRTELHFNKLIELTLRYNRFTSFADQAAISLWCYVNKLEFSNCIEFNFQTCFLVNQYIMYNEMFSKKRTLSDVRIMHFSWWKLDTEFHKSLLENSSILAEIQKQYLLE